MHEARGPTPWQLARSGEAQGPTPWQLARSPEAQGPTPWQLARSPEALVLQPVAQMQISHHLF